MKRGLHKGLFITFEGAEGTGKTTQIGLLADYLEDRGHDVVTTREPGGTPVGAAIRAVLLNPEYTEMDYHTEVLLYAADRAQHVAQIIRPALSEGGIVISDRFIDSSVAYQHFGRGLPLDLILDVNERAVQGLKPDITFLLTAPAELGLRRATQVTADRIEQESIDFHNRVEAGFREIASWEPGRWRVIDGTLSIEGVHRAVIEAIETFL